MVTAVRGHRRGGSERHRAVMLALNSYLSKAAFNHYIEQLQNTEERKATSPVGPLRLTARRLTDRLSSPGLSLPLVYISINASIARSHEHPDVKPTGPDVNPG